MSALSASAQTDTIRYVNIKTGKYANDGKTWETAKDNVQDAINDLYNYMQTQNVHSGSVYVAAGTYTPSESTGDGSSVLSTSFKIYDGIHVYGGFNVDKPEKTPDERVLSSKPAWRDNQSGLDNDKQSTEKEQTITMGDLVKMEKTAGSTIMRYDFKNATIFSGNHNTVMGTFQWNDNKKQYDTRFPGNSYHVVWFATNGYVKDAAGNNTLYADSLVYGASLDGCIIQDGNASGRSTADRDLNAFGGGVYMVQHATVRNCVIRRCSASRRGGGVYMDRGGTVKDCNIYQCQTLGIGVIDGYGGGVCMENNGVMRHCNVMNNMARTGGGLMIVYTPEKHPYSTKYTKDDFDPYATVCVFSNNNANTEGAGVVLYRGGVLNHCTIVNNECTGTDITIGGVRYGRTGGLFIYGAGSAFNSVVWGNTCAANNNIQYGYYATTDLYANATAQRPRLSYMAFSNFDITDWGNALRSNVFQISKENFTPDKAGNYPIFTLPSTKAGANGATATPLDWMPNAMSYLQQKGVQVSQLNNFGNIITKSHSAKDFVRNVFDPVSALGAFAIMDEQYKVAELPAVDGTDATTKIPTLFVDPNRVIKDKDVKTSGESWDTPLDNVSEAVKDMEEYINKNKDKGITKTQILVKQGNITTAGSSSYLYDTTTGEADLESAALHLLGNMLMYGGYSSSLTGTAVDLRNPKENVTRINGNIVGNYKYNSVHCVVFPNVQNAVLDGFYISYGNAEKPDDPNYNNKDPEGSYSYRQAYGYGAGIFIGARSRSDRKQDMTGNVVRNCVISNCWAPMGGAAVFVSGDNYRTDNTSTLQQAALTMENCIIHNNGVRNKQDKNTVNQWRESAGIIQAVGNATITMRHCTVVNNVGTVFSAYTDKGSTPTISVTNSAIYSNATDSLTDRTQLNDKGSNLAALYYNGTNGNAPTGSNNQIDTLYYKHTGLSDNLKKLFIPTFGNDRSNDHNYPRFVNPVRTIFVQRNADDPTLYGGTIDYTPMNMNPMVNAASVATNEDVTTETDFVLNHRNYGGKPDVGAIENTTQPENGTTYFVRTNGNDNNDGLSWATAFATIDHALKVASSGQSVWVAQGVYKENLTMIDGVNVYGGFKSYGNPGKREGERDISNLDSTYQTIIDGQFKGHVLNQDANFSNATLWEGITIQNGTNLIPTSTGSVSTISEKSINTGSSDWSKDNYGTKITKTITRTFTSQYKLYYNGNYVLAYGGGAYIVKNATLKNCLIRYNHYFQSYPSSITVKVAPTTTYTTTTITKASADAEEVRVTKDSVSNVPYMTYVTPSSGTAFGKDMEKGGSGIYLGSGAVLENCVVRNNEGKIYNNTYKMVGCGILSDGGTVLNSLIVENYTTGGNCLGVAMYLKTKSFIYNTTIAYNLATNISGLPCCPGVWDHAANGGDSNFANNCSKFYNTIFWANIGYGNTGENFNQVCRTTYRSAIGKTGHMFNCYHSVPCVVYGNAGVNSDGTEITNDTLIFDTYTFSTTKGKIDVGVTNVNTNKYYNSCRAQDLFNESQYIYPTGDEKKGTQISSIETDNPYSINPASDLAKYCINLGSETYGTKLTQTLKVTEDIAGADRIQDCRIDKGAYEYNGASEIKPETGTEKHRVYSSVPDMKGEEKEFTVATYYVSQNGDGVRDASSAANAACNGKLQQVLDAAGRYKYDHPRDHVVVKLAQVHDGGYAPSRTTDYNTNVDINPRQFSIQIPHGVEVQGGWNDDFTKRDPLNNKTLLKGTFNYGDGTSTAYHVVTFTDYVFDENGNRISKGKDADGLPIYKLLSETVKTYKATWEATPGNNLFSRSLINGCYIENGQADGVMPEDQRGGAAVVTGFADISNCVIQNNSASGYGGGLYVEPSGIVSGCILQDNKAAYGAGIAIAEPDNPSLDTWAILAYNTIVYNNASVNGGGIFFNTNLRSIGNVVWQNTSNDQGDIAGVVTVDASQDVWNFPVNYTAVTNVREAGVNNISVNSQPDEGVRWQADTNLKTDTRKYQYYYLQQSSVLTRAALPYTTMRNMIRFFPGIDSVDIAGVKRMAQTDATQSAYDGTALVEKDNVTTDIGARAINFAFKIQAAKVFYRLFVVHPTNVSNSNANALLESGDEIYKQVGSSFANPFQRLGDAFDYIMNVRKRDETAGDTTPEKEKPRNHRFEVFVAGGTYYPYTDMYGNQGDVRSNTFNIPEGVTVIGGIDVSKPEHMYCQETSGETTVNGVTLYGSTTDEIRNSRVRYDLNKNSVVEPWEMKSQTILSGLSVGSDLQVKNVYHVINCNADEKSVGKLPKYFSDDNLTNTTMDATKESTASRLNRTIILDGLTIRDGSAMGYETTVQNMEWYYRGGGIFIDGTTIADKEVDTKTGMETPMRSIPMVVSNTLFQNNSARLGGAIYTNGQLDVVGCSFVQNYSKSPDNTDADKEDRDNVAWSGGGAIATNDEVTIVNSIFANNEAKRGTGTLTHTYTDGNNVTNNATLGFGGVLWAGDNSSIAILNCNSVRNKAHSFPSIYNTLPNSSSPKIHIAVNSIFWGNEVDKDGDKQLANFGNEKKEALFFCAYQDGHGLPVQTSTTDQRANDGISYANMHDIFTILGGNNNVIISDNNEAVDGPNFILPSSKAGVDGYMQSANWLISRVNLLTDAGWGEIDQDEKGNYKYKTDASGEYEAHGIYPLLSTYYKNSFKLTLLPLGKDKYMNYADDKNEESTENMNRISADPLGNTTKDYIDIGVYEYQHSQLTVADGDEVDVMWVSDEEKTGAKTADGRSWDTPTSDLQRAIETLLLSRNDKPKVVKIMGGTYSPTYTLDESNNGFQIHTGANDGMVALKKTIISGHDYQAKSLTIEGGYSKEIVGARDIEQNPTILEMAKKSTSSADNMAHLFLISDAEQWGTQGNRGSTTGEIDVTQGGINKSSESTGKVMPITFDGLTFVNKYADAKHTESTGTIGGAAIYYKEQFVTGATGKKSTTDHLEATDVPKLTIKNCIFQQNGADNTKPVPAVRVEQGGGRTLIYNSVFHSGSGNPLESTDAVSIVNCTFAMNGGHIKLSGAATGTSSLYNSIIWQDDRNNEMKTQYEGFTADNAATDSVQYNAITGIENVEENDAYRHNVGLDDRNYNAMEGPNFVNGDGKDVSLRDYHINPGVRTLTRANYLLYARKVLGWVPKMTIKGKDGASVTLDEKNILTMLADTAYTKDLANKVRLYDGSMERGAYECSSAMQRVLFVDPVKINTNKTTGLSWENAYGSGSIQRAIDAAAVYTYFNDKTTDNKQAKSYVFVKGANNDNATPEAITLRNGVSVYGSIASGYTEEPEPTKDKETGDVLLNNGARSFENAAIDEYIQKVKASRPGLAAKTTHRTRVASISTMAMTTGYGFGALVDGVEVRGDKTKTVTEPVINIKDQIDNLVLRNMIIDGNTVSKNNDTGAPVVNLQYGLLYNALLYGNAVAANQPIVSVDKDATMLNCTVVAEAAEQKTVNNAGKVINCIDYNRIDNNVETSGSGTYTNCYSDTGNPFAPYLRADGNVYKLPAFLTGHAPYYYQLHENSKAINACTKDFTLPDRFKAYVDLSNDRDLLGNPRTLGGTVDMGCFETWLIKDDDSRYATADNNRYPHEGSVVYIGKNASLSLGSASSSKQIFTGENAFMPGYLLLKAGASLYGNGNVIHAAYVAAERSFPKGMQYTLMSLPFPYDYANALTTTMDDAGNITETKYEIPTGKTYNGEKRSAWDYSFKTANSDCWETMTSTQVNACDGWLLKFDDPLTGAVDIRFTSFGSQDGDYVYSEDGSAKTVKLTQYNTIATGGSAHFTKLENMGWNLKGMPWLVSRYNTANSADGKSYDMSAPHVFYTVTADGNNFTESQSWTYGASLGFGSAFFTQTAVIGDKATETVTFALPPLPSKTPDPAAKPFVALADENGATDDVVVRTSEDSKALAFSLGSDGVKWQSFNDSVPQVYLLDNSGVALSLAGNAPVGVEMAMGYRAAKDGVLTVSLPDADAFDGQQVWLKDQETGVVTDLTTGSYQFQAAKGYTDNRLTLQIGGVQPDGTKLHGDEGDALWTVHVVDGCLQVKGVMAGDLVTVRALSGMSVKRGRAMSDTFVTQPLVQGVYIVTVNNRSKKVAVHTRF